MIRSRLSRIENRRQEKQLKMALFGTLGLLVFLALFGVRILVGFSLLVDRIRGTTPQSEQNQALVLPPVLDPQPSATNSASISISGRGQPGMQLLLFRNDKEVDKVTIPDDGAFTVSSVTLSNGTNAISAKQTDGKDSTSELSNILSIRYSSEPPSLVVSTPEDNTTISGDKNTVRVEGMTDEDVTVTINDRFVVVKGDNTFSYDYPLSEGDTVLSIVATDDEGNQTKIERKVSYHK